MGVTDLSNPSTDIKTTDWLQWYTEIQIKLQKVKEENKKIEDDTTRRQSRYIEREQNYRKSIDDLQRELRVRQGYEKDAYAKNRMVIDTLGNEIKKSIDNIAPKAEKLKKDQESDIMRKFQSELLKLKKKLEE